MNTSLLTTNTTTCTTKNITMMAAVICMTAVFVFTNTAVFAQGFSNSQGKAENSSATTEEQRAAKEARVKEHQEELSKTVNPAVVKPAPVQTKSGETAVQPVKVKKTETPTSISNAQGLSIKSNTEEQSIKSTEVKPVQVTQVKTPVVIQEVKATDPSNQPYYNYKGISDLNKAKEAWASDNNNVEKSTQELFVNYKGIQDPAQAKMEWVKDNQPASK